jgi:catechol 2,3-dioxygenase-like lactoylglutathione lyase family enzyme
MRLLKRLCCLGLLYAAGASAAEPSALLRTTLIVSDLDRTLAFYQRLGFRPESDRGGPRKPGSPFPVDAPATVFRLVILATSDPQGGKIGLLTFGKPSPPVTVPARPKVGIGDMVFVIRVDDLPAVYADLKGAGAPLVEPEPVPFDMQRPDGSAARGALFHVFDPDGRLVEVMAPARMDAPPRGQ